MPNYGGGWAGVQGGDCQDHQVLLQRGGHGRHAVQRGLTRLPRGGQEVRAGAMFFILKKIVTFRNDELLAFLIHIKIAPILNIFSKSSKSIQ